jgi:hypothetical protein
VDAQKQDTLHERGLPKTNLMTTTANRAPNNCINTNIGTDSGAIPANVLLRLRAMLTAGFANEVDEVKKYKALSKQDKKIKGDQYLNNIISVYNRQ